MMALKFSGIEVNMNVLHLAFFFLFQFLHRLNVDEGHTADADF